MTFLKSLYCKFLTDLAAGFLLYVGLFTLSMFLFFWPSFGYHITELLISARKLPLLLFRMLHL